MKIRIKKVELVGLILSLLGLVLVFQPITPQLYTYGYGVLSIGAVIFVLSGYLPRRTEHGETYLRDLIRWIAIITFVLLFVIGVSIMLVPYFVVR